LEDPGTIDGKPDWKYDAEASKWNAFVPKLEALYGRIEFLKP
jgi:hypothetical protein